VLTFLNLPIYWLLVRRYQHLGLAMASSIGIVVYTLLLAGLLNRRTKNRETTDLVWFFLKVTMASVIAAAVCFRLARILHALIGWQSTLHALTVLVILSSVGFLITGLLAKLFRVRELDSYLAKFHL
jgi:peptidoglycan biosynthesis protein MviN/MurJ (putative lipid II flippase)